MRKFIIIFLIMLMPDIPACVSTAFAQSDWSAVPKTKTIALGDICK